MPIGHSDRQVFGETDDEVRQKIEEALNVGLFLWLASVKQRRKATGKREYRLKKQLMKAFANLQLNGGKLLWLMNRSGQLALARLAIRRG